jgi:hypothetical protein
MDYGPDNLTAKLGYNPKVDRTMPRQVILDLWKQEMMQKDDWRAIVEPLADDEDEYIWMDRNENEPGPRGQKVSRSISSSSHG